MEVQEERRVRQWGELYTRRYEVFGARAEIILVHGFGEHSGRYEALIRHLLEHGYAITAYDHRGHGKSSGLYGHIDRFSDYEEDLDSLIGETVAAQPQRLLFLVGHSMGGLVVLRQLLRNATGIGGAVISAPLLAIAAKVALHKLLLARVGAVVAPRLRLPNDIPPQALSRDPEVGRAYAADPLVGKLVSTRWFAEAVRAMAEVRENASRITTPLLLLHGTADRLAAVTATQELFPQLASTDKELKIYEGYYHELFNEPEKQEVYERVSDWLNARA